MWYRAKDLLELSRNRLSAWRAASLTASTSTTLTGLPNGTRDIPEAELDALIDEACDRIRHGVHDRTRRSLRSGKCHWAGLTSARD
jgi:hypothetical protein